MIKISKNEYKKHLANLTAEYRELKKSAESVIIPNQRDIKPGQTLEEFDILRDNAFSLRKTYLDRADAIRYQAVTFQKTHTAV